MDFTIELRAKRNRLAIAMISISVVWFPMELLYLLWAGRLTGYQWFQVFIVVLGLWCLYSFWRNRPPVVFRLAGRSLSVFREAGADLAEIHLDDLVGLKWANKMELAFRTAAGETFLVNLKVLSLEDRRLAQQALADELPHLRDRLLAAPVPAAA